MLYEVITEVIVFRFVVEEIPESGQELVHTLDAAWARPYCGAQFQVGTSGVRMTLKLSRADNTIRNNFV